MFAGGSLNEPHLRGVRHRGPRGARGGCAGPSEGPRKGIDRDRCALYATQCLPAASCNLTSMHAVLGSVMRRRILANDLGREGE